MSTKQNIFSYFLLFAASLALLGSTSQVSQGAVFLDINFDAQQNGDPVAVTFPTAPPPPQTEPYGTGGFPNVGPYTGTVTVVSAPGLNKAALMSTNQGGIGANWMDTQFLVSGDLIQFDFDIRIVDQSAGAYPQATPSAPNGQLFAINAFALDAVNRIFRFAVTPTSNTAGEFAMRNNSNGDLISIGTYDVGEDYHVTILADYLSKTVDVSIANVGSLLDLPFVDAAGNGMSELFFFQNGIEGSPNQVALDNIRAQTLSAVPEPSSLVLLGLGMVGLVGVARRKSLSKRC